MIISLVYCSSRITCCFGKERFCPFFALLFRNIGSLFKKGEPFYRRVVQPLDGWDRAWPERGGCCRANESIRSRKQKTQAMPLATLAVVRVSARRLKTNKENRRKSNIGILHYHSVCVAINTPPQDKACCKSLSPQKKIACSWSSVALAASSE